MKKWLIVLIAVLLAFAAAACHTNDNGADGAIYFDAESVGWQGADDIRLLLFDLEDGVLSSDNSETLAGTKGRHYIWSFQAGSDVRAEKVYCVMFHNADTQEETYPLLLNTACLGDTARADHSRIENPSDSETALYVVRWRESSLGPMLQITSIGNVIGETIAMSTTPYQMFVNFLASRRNISLAHALEYSGRDAQTEIDAVAGELSLTKQDVIKAIEEAREVGHSVTGDKTDWSGKWSPQKSFIPKEAEKSNKSGISGSQN